MEEYRNKVANLHANQSQNISKFTSEIYPEEPPEVNRGGGMGGPTSLLATVVAPPLWGPWAMGQPRLQGTEDLAWGGWPKAPWHPLLGGGRYTLERRRVRES